MEKIGLFTIHRQDTEAVLICPEFVDDICHEEDESKLLELIDSYDRVVCDLSKCELVIARWLIFFHQMTRRAKVAGKKFVMLGAHSTIRDSVRYLGILDSFVWEPLPEFKKSSVRMLGREWYEFTNEEAKWELHSTYSKLLFCAPGLVLSIDRGMLKDMLPFLQQFCEHGTLYMKPEKEN